MLTDTISVLATCKASDVVGQTQDTSPMIALEIVFWVCAGLIVWTQVGYAATLAVLVRAAQGADPAASQRPSRCPRCR